MDKKANLLFLKAETPIHAGSGDSLGIIDLPIQRERHTGFPKIEASSLKGSIREAFEYKLIKLIDDENRKKENLRKINIAFGVDDSDLDKFRKDEIQAEFLKDDTFQTFAGALSFIDSRILLFPVKSLRGIFAYITCPFVLKRLNTDWKVFKNEDLFEYNDFNELENTASNLDHLHVNKNSVMLEEFTFELQENENTKDIVAKLSEISGIEMIKDKLVILPDDIFKDYVSNFTEAITRTKIDNENGTVEQGALWTEEYLPSETIMYSFVVYDDPHYKKINDFKASDEVKTFFEETVNNSLKNILQIGGNATIGKGLTNIKLV